MRLGLFLAILTALLSGCSAPAGPVFREIAYSLTGGIGGVDHQLTVGLDGSYRYSGRGQAPAEGRLSAAETEELERLVAAVNWALLDARYVNPRVADARFQTVIARREDGKVWTVVVGTGGEPPPDLAALLQFLEQLQLRLRTSESGRGPEPWWLGPQLMPSPGRRSG